jgi:hypothetical protein
LPWEETIEILAKVVKFAAVAYLEALSWCRRKIMWPDEYSSRGLGVLNPAINSLVEVDFPSEVPRRIV